MLLKTKKCQWMVAILLISFGLISACGGSGGSDSNNNKGGETTSAAVDLSGTWQTWVFVS